LLCVSLGAGAVRGLLRGSALLARASGQGRFISTQALEALREWYEQGVL
jgi:hypothetical protein